MLLYRALNELDIAANPLENGLASKKLVYDLTLSYLQSTEGKFLNSLSAKEKDEYVKQNMLSYLRNHEYKLAKMFNRRSQGIRNDLFNINPNKLMKNEHELQYYYEKFDQSWTYLIYYLSSLNNHLINGSKTYTDWISSTKQLGKCGKYYHNQDIHQLAIICTASKGLADENTIVVDVSSRELIEELLPFISKRIKEKDFKQYIASHDNNLEYFIQSGVFNPSSNKFMGYNFSIASEEVSILRHMPSQNIISVLGSLQIDLLRLKSFNLKSYCLLDKKEQLQELNKLLSSIKEKIDSLSDSELSYIFNEIYMKNKDYKTLVTEDLPSDRINYNRGKILKIAQNVPNIQIKR